MHKLFETMFLVLEKFCRVFSNGEPGTKIENIYCVGCQDVK